MRNKFKDGEEVFAKAAPSLKLIIRRKWNEIYFCKIKEDPSAKEKIYFEKELLSESEEVPV